MDKSIQELIIEAIVDLDEIISVEGLGAFFVGLMVYNNPEDVGKKFEKILSEKGYVCQVQVWDAPYIKIITPFHTNHNPFLKRQVKHLKMDGVFESVSGTVFIHTEFDKVFTLDTTNVALMAKNIIGNEQLNTVDEVGGFILANIILNADYIELIYTLTDQAIDCLEDLDNIFKEFKPTIENLE